MVLRDIAVIAVAFELPVDSSLEGFFLWCQRRTIDHSGRLTAGNPACGAVEAGFTAAVRAGQRDQRKTLGAWFVRIAASQNLWV